MGSDFDNKGCGHNVFFAVMAGLAPEGSQFDANKYDSKMNDLYDFYFLLFGCNLILLTILITVFLSCFVLDSSAVRF